MVKKNLFRDKVISIVKSIKRGETMTYGEVAKRAGHPFAARAVGAIMRTNTNTSVPCHRVVSKNGLGGYNGLLGKKRALLKAEGALA